MVPDRQLHNRGNSSSSKGEGGVREITKAVATREVATRVGITIIMIIKGVPIREIMATLVRTGISRMIRGIMDHHRVKMGPTTANNTPLPPADC